MKKQKKNYKTKEIKFIIEEIIYTTVNWAP